MQLVAPTKFYSIAEIAELLFVKTDKVSAWIKSRELVAVNVAVKRNGKPRWRITAEAFAAFQAGRSTDATKPTVVQRRQRKSAAQPRSWIK